MRPWSTEEVEATVAAYFEMLGLELAGLPYVKAEANERLRKLLDGRSKAAVEYKFQNISAVLVNHDQTYIKGYLPAQNYQAALESAVLEWLEGQHDLAALVHASPVVNPPPPTAVLTFSGILASPPDVARAPRQTGRVLVRKIDFVRLDAENRALGQRGEELAFELEQRRLHDDLQRPDLARQVRWVARDEGDGLGYDIRSFEGSGEARLIEVKTTGQGKYFPFAVTRNELTVSQREANRYHLYRLFDFGQSPGLYVLGGALDKSCTLSPTQFRATVGTPALG